MVSSFTYNEISTQAEAMKKTLEVVSGKAPFKQEMQQYIFTGCGTSYYLAIAGARFFQETTDIPANAIPASELFLHSRQVFTDNSKYKVIAISRSGTTSEILQALKSVKDFSNISTMAFTCNQDTEMVKRCDESITLSHVDEKSVVMTQSFTNMLYAIQLYSAYLSNQTTRIEELKNLPLLIKDTLGKTDSIKEIAQNISFTKFIFLGTGINFGIAEEACLKLKEMTQTECEAFGSLEFRHGPISVVDRNTITIILSTERTQEIDEEIVKDIQRFGGYTITIGGSIIKNSDTHLCIPSTVSDSVSSLVNMPYLQMLAYYRALKLGLDPDKPRNLNQVVKISLPN